MKQTEKPRLKPKKTNWRELVSERQTKSRDIEMKRNASKKRKMNVRLKKNSERRKQPDGLRKKKKPQLERRNLIEWQVNALVKKNLEDHQDSEMPALVVLVTVNTFPPRNEVAAIGMMIEKEAEDTTRNEVAAMVVAAAVVVVTLVAAAMKVALTEMEAEALKEEADGGDAKALLIEPLTHRSLVESYS